MRKLLWMVWTFSIVTVGCSKSESQRSSEREATPVKVVAVEALEVNRELSLSGIVKPKEEVRLSFKLGGEVKEVFFEESEEGRCAGAA